MHVSAAAAARARVQSSDMHTLGAKFARLLPPPLLLLLASARASTLPVRAQRGAIISAVLPAPFDSTPAKEGTVREAAGASAPAGSVCLQCILAAHLPTKPRPTSAA